MLAIVIPYYKLTFFEETLQSLADQTNKRFKVYIGDDASPENPEIALKKFEGQFDFIYHRFKSNLGGTSLTQQWERCIALIDDEEWVNILGDDDVLGKNVVEEFYKNEQLRKKSNVCRFASVKIDENSNAFSEIYTHPQFETRYDFLERKTRSSLSEYFFRISELSQSGFKSFPLGWYSDILAVLEVAGSKQIFTCNDAVIYIRISRISISGNYRNTRQKYDASFLYHYYLLNNHGFTFAKEQKEIFLQQLTRSYLSNKKNLNHFFKVQFALLKHGNIKNYFKFVGKIFSN
ncbi:glycosyltransferase [Flavobacterium sp. NST-5]|uniref:Glycosyltransferase n=1 Tax=Flavobacterium ichthyis TaxID=2698827 RepID=A0ABW9Z7I3_9FLAO|nr:glycosyltransferase [Flavobacterium ichthyis]NBL64833.1 glycosyltransferase [Flavobacterium ichthyis]